MLLRQQVLIEDWLVEYLKFLSEKYDLSYSEVIRLGLCAQFDEMITLNYPDIRSKIDKKKFLQLLRKSENNKDSREELLKFISMVYFEARKTIEARMAKEKNKRK
jgi:metal-responsive CopG/Arc/MetJ family transcriptional regulator